MIEEMIAYGDLGLSMVLLIFLYPKITRLETDVKNIKEQMKNGRK
jgi:hypothetical protein